MPEQRSETQKLAEAAAASARQHGTPAVIERWATDGPMPESVIVRTFYTDGRMPTERTYWPEERSS